MICEADDTLMPVKKVETREEFDKVRAALSVNICKMGKNVLSEASLMFFRGIPSWVQFYENEPVTLFTAYLGKRRVNVWSPYINAYSVFTRVDMRRRGFASRLALRVRKEAVAFGCRRLKDVAGTYIGYRFHASLNDDFWGWTDKGSLVIDTPLIDPSNFPSNATPISARKWTDRTRPFTKEEVEEFIKDKKFIYDK